MANTVTVTVDDIQKTFQSWIEDYQAKPVKYNGPVNMKTDPYAYSLAVAPVFFERLKETQAGREE